MSQKAKQWFLPYDAQTGGNPKVRIADITGVIRLPANDSPLRGIEELLTASSEAASHNLFVGYKTQVYNVRVFQLKGNPD